MKAIILLILTLCYSFTNSFRSLDESGLVSIPFSTVTEKNYLIAPVSIGTPEQNLNLVLDIGSERTWIYMEEYTIEAEGLLARAICHELDHLEGILYKDKAEGGLHPVEPVE